MDFNLYNLLSTLIPGFIVLMAGMRLLNFDVNNIPVLPSTAVAFVMGYFINAIGGWLEKFLFWTWGGEPAIQLLEGKNCGRIKFYEVEKLKSFFNTEENINNKKTFQIAMRLSNGNERVSDMNVSYVFSRSILTTLLVAYFILLPVYFKNIYFEIISIFLIFLSWYRAKERGFYYVKEVLTATINIKEGR